jgi:hypothetical protein
MEASALRDPSHGLPDDGGAGETISAEGEAEDRDLPSAVCIPIHEARDITAVSAATSEVLMA